MIDPGGIATWSVTHVDWSERKWHPKSYRAQDVTYELLNNITVCFILSFPVGKFLCNGVDIVILSLERIAGLRLAANGPFCF